MVKKYGAAAGVILLIFLAVAFYPTDKRKVRRLMKNTAEWASKEAGENLVVVAARSKKAEKLFAQRVDFVYEKREMERQLSVEDIERGYLYLMQQKTSFKVKLADVGIEITGDDTATADATPTKLPVPIVAASAVDSAPKWLM